ncbi:MAG: exosome complex RNA-binding protein Csl4 [Thermoprotei archaeon]
MRSQSDFALPGEEIGVIEELLPGEGTYEDDGTVRAAVVGRVFIDMINRKGNVTTSKRPGMLSIRKAKYVYFLVEQVKEDLAIGTIVGIEDRPVNSHLSAYIHISQVANKRIERLTDYLKAGDIVKARPLGSALPIPLTIKQQDLGVVLAKCSVCGGDMVQVDEEHLRCVVCKNVESRKLPEVRRRGS